MKPQSATFPLAQPGTQGRLSLLLATLCALGSVVAPSDANAWIVWVNYPYPAHDDAARTPSENCQAVYEVGGARAAERSSASRALLQVHYQLNAQYYEASFTAGDGEWVNGQWSGNPPSDALRRKAGSCWGTLWGDRRPVQADQDYSGEVVDHDWPIDLIIPRPPSQPISFPPPFPPPPPMFTKEELDGFVIPFTGPDGTRYEWVRGFRNVSLLENDKLVDRLQMGWILFREKTATGAP